MSTTTDTVSPDTELQSDDLRTEPSEKEKTSKSPKSKSPIDAVLDFLSSVKVGVSLLALMIVATAIGTFIIQKGTSGFREYYQQLLPAERALYTTLGFLDIYHTWWFNLLLLTVSLNIILASIDYFPAAWRYVKKPVLKINDVFVGRQPWKEKANLSADAANVERLRKIGETLMRPSLAAGPLKYLSSLRVRTTEAGEKGTTILFDLGWWNRLMPYAIHTSLLMIFGGAFVGGQFGHKGLIRLEPGTRENTFVTQAADPTVEQDQVFEMPFELVCTDIQQDLLDPNKPDLSAPNTLDWHTRVLVRYRGQDYEGHIHLNTPMDFRGFRFFQASFDPVASARTVTLNLEPKAGGAPKTITVERRPSTVPGLGTFRLAGFQPDFTVNGGQPDTASGDYKKPVAQIEWTPEGSTTPTQVWAFPAKMMDMAASAPMIASKIFVGENRVVMTDFEKVSQAHILQVQYDPGVNTVYWGCGLLILFLWMTFFFPHQRVWVLVVPNADGTSTVSVTGNTNRNRPAFEKKFNMLAAYLLGKSAAERSAESTEE